MKTIKLMIVASTPEAIVRSVSLGVEINGDRAIETVDACTAGLTSQEEVAVRCLKVPFGIGELMIGALIAVVGYGGGRSRMDDARATYPRTVCKRLELLVNPSRSEDNWEINASTVHLRDFAQRFQSPKD